jgi:hypothetical protein
MSRLEEMRAACNRFNREHPEVWRYFLAFIAEARANDIEVGAKAVWERIRWECEVMRDQTFKLNNNFAAFYARRYNREMDEDYFETREQISANVEDEGREEWWDK